MQKYFLVASYYDRYTKTYNHETEVTLPNIDLTTIQSIDNFTSSHTYFEIIDLIKKEADLSDINTLSIKYYKNQNSSPIYYRVICNNSLFNECTTNTTNKTYNIHGKPITAPVIRKNSILYQKELNKLFTILDKKVISEFTRIYKNDNIFSNLVINYMTTSYDENGEDEARRLIETEFSRYKTFRGWIIAQEKLQRSYKYVPKTNNIVQKVQPIKGPIKSITENETLFEQQYKKEHGISYQEAQIQKHNTSYLENETEEFIEGENELEQMYNYQEGAKYTKGR